MMIQAIVDGFSSMADIFAMRYHRAPFIRDDQMAMLSDWKRIRTDFNQAFIKAHESLDETQKESVEQAINARENK